MQNKCIVEKSFIQDTGFNYIREWLLKHSNCKENEIYFQNLHPTYNIDKLNEELSQTDELFKALLRKDFLIEARLEDISEPISALAIDGNFISISDFYQIRCMLDYHLSLTKYFKSKELKLWRAITPPINQTKSVIKKIDKIIDEEMNVKKNASKELSQIYKLIKQTESKIESKIEHELNKYIKLGYLRDNKTVYRSGKILFPVNASSKNKIKGIVDSFSSTGQTCFVQPISLVELNNKMNELVSEKKKEIIKILMGLTEDISSDKDFLNQLYNLIKYYDIHYTIANFAIVTDSVIPEFENQLILKNAINPLFTLKKKKYVPLNISIKDRGRTIIISGPNSGGKTVVIKSVGLYCLMAQSGLYIPSKKAITPIFKSFLSDIGDKQSLNDDLSTFSAHMKEISSILKISDEHSLVIIDEMGTGTDPDIGSSLSVSILKKLTEKRALSLCTTHLAPLKVWANENPNAENACMEFDNKKIEPTFIFQMGMPGSSYGIEIAERMGINQKIIKDASQNLNQKSFEMEKLIKNISDKEKEITNKIEILNKESIKVENEKITLNQVKKDLEEKKKKIRQVELSESKEYLLGYRKKIEALIENIKHTNANKITIKETKNFINEQLENINNDQERAIKSNEKISIGDCVQIKGISDSGTIINIDRKLKNVIVEIDGKKITTRINDLMKSNNHNNKSQKKNVIHTKIKPLQSQRLDIRGKRVDEAIIELDKFLDKAILSNLKSVDILHGKGTGALQQAIHEYLSNIKFVEKFDFAPIDQGGAGITIVEIS